MIVYIGNKSMIVYIGNKSMILYIGNKYCTCIYIYAYIKYNMTYE